MNRAPLVGGIPSRDYAALGDQFARMATAGGSAGGGDSSVVNFYGLTYEQAAMQQRREQHRRSLLHGVRRLR